jgi:hypothetical protein
MPDAGEPPASSIYFHRLLSLPYKLHPHTFAHHTRLGDGEK